MVNLVFKYYVKFPPIARKAINFSIASVMSGLNVDYYHSEVEAVLLDCHDIIKFKN